tara:strand:+ start:1453 stop:2430 length:978 start_codon:yes stop_codon:yes gene_type:complete
MNITFLTEMNFEGKISPSHPNMRTEFAWMNALDASHTSISNYTQVKGNDHVFIIFPKGQLNLNAVASKLISTPNPHSELLNSNWLNILKENNKNVYYVQEGPTWMFTELEIQDQFNFYNMLASVDAIYAHNKYDTKFYKGLVPGQRVQTIPTLMIEDLIKDIKPRTEDKVLIGGNFARWYNGFQSYLVASEFNIPIWAQDSHAKREHENQVPNLTHLPRVSWVEWMKEVSSFKYAVHLMPTIAAGTFSLNCAYFGIPCIGNKKVDTQNICHPDLCVDVDDVEKARNLAIRLRDDISFYNKCSIKCKSLYRKNYDLNVWKRTINLK